MKVKIKLEGNEAKHALTGLLGGLPTGTQDSPTRARTKTSMTTPPALRKTPMGRMAARISTVSRHG